MKQHDPKHASDDAFEDRPTGTWRAVRAAKGLERECEPEATELDPEQLVELAN